MKITDQDIRNIITEANCRIGHGNNSLSDFVEYLENKYKEVFTYD